MWCTGLVALQHVGSSWTRAQTHVPCIGRQTPNHCATREARWQKTPDVAISRQLSHFWLNHIFYAVSVQIPKSSLTPPFTQVAPGLLTSLSELPIVWLIWMLAAGLHFSDLWVVTPVSSFPRTLSALLGSLGDSGHLAHLLSPPCEAALRAPGLDFSPLLVGCPAPCGAQNSYEGLPRSTWQTVGSWVPCL